MKRPVMGPLLASRLMRLARDEVSDIDTRALALELLAASGAFDHHAALLIGEFLNSTDDTLNFVAIAAASDLAPATRDALRPSIQRFLKEGGRFNDDVRNAARAFLERDAHS